MPPSPYGKTKIGTEVAHVTRDSDTNFKVKRSNVNLQGAGAYCGGLPHSLLQQEDDDDGEEKEKEETTTTTMMMNNNSSNNNKTAPSIYRKVGGPSPGAEEYPEPDSLPKLIV